MAGGKTREVDDNTILEIVQRLVKLELMQKLCLGGLLALTSLVIAENRHPGVVAAIRGYLTVVADTLHGIT
jgi:hypothetical protein